MEDENDDVRDWATLGLARQLELDGHGIREALARRFSDTCRDVCDEAIAGLARRRDRRALEPLRDRLWQGDPSSWVLEAASYLGDPSLLPALEALESGMNGDAPDASYLVHAIWACDPERQRRWRQQQGEFLRALEEAVAGAGKPWVPTLSCRRLELDVDLDVRLPGGEKRFWDLRMLLVDRSGGDVAAAVMAALAAGDDPVGPHPGSSA